MKNRKEHLFYGLIILVLGFQWWTTAQELSAANATLAHLNQQTLIDIDWKERVIQFDKIQIDVNVKGYPSPPAVENRKNALACLAESDATITFFNSVVEELNRADSNFSFFSNKTRHFFNAQKVQSLQDSLSVFNQKCQLKIDSFNRQEFAESMIIGKLLKDKPFWDRFKQLNKVNTISLLTDILAKIKMDEAKTIRYIMRRIGGDFPFYQAPYLAIIPKQASIIEGETLTADIYITYYVPIHRQYSDEISLLVNGEKLSINDGIANFKKQYFEIGKKTIKATATNRNPLTGRLESIIPAELAFEVLPKCSKNCR